MSRPLSKRIREALIGLLLIIIANLLVFLSILRYAFTLGREYFESGQWHPLPKFLTDQQFGEHKTAYLKKINLHYVESGDRSKPLLLLVHGFPEFWYSWHYQIVEFQKDYRVVAMDLRGYGLSDKPQDVASYKMEILIDDIMQLLDHLEVERCTLVGHDWGGGIAWAFAQTYPEKLHQAIIMNCPQSKAFKELLKTSFKQIKAAWYMFFFQTPYIPEWYMRRMDYKLFEKMFTSPRMGLKKGAITAEEIEAYIANISQPGSLTSAVNYYRATFRYPLSLDGKVEVPVLLIWGTEDGALTIQLPEACKKYCKDLTIKYIDGASHWVQQDCPEDVNIAMREFLSRPDATSHWTE